MVLEMRKIRGVVLITAALVAIASASIAYLRPAPPGHVSTGSVSASTQSQAVQKFNLTGRLDGGYFVWERPGGGSGGHAG